MDRYIPLKFIPLKKEALQLSFAVISENPPGSLLVKLPNGARYEVWRKSNNIYWVINSDGCRSSCSSMGKEYEEKPGTVATFFKELGYRQQSFLKSG